MYNNFGAFLNQSINSKIIESQSLLMEAIPVEIMDINQDTSVNCKSLIDKRQFNNAPLFCVTGYSFKIENVKFGLFIPTPYFFYSILDKDKVDTPLRTSQANYGLVIPLLDKNNHQKDNQDFDAVIHSKDNQNKITIDDQSITLDNQGKSGLTINSNSPIELKTQVATLKEIMDDLINCINLASLGTGNTGSPIIPNPGLSTLIESTKAKLNGVLK